MALAVSIRYSFSDINGEPSFTKIRVPNGFSISQYQEFCVASAQLLKNFSNGRITRVGVSVGIDLSGLGLKTSANVLADIFNKAQFIFSTVVTGFRAKLRLPTFNEDFTGEGTKAIDQADVDVAAFLSALENGIVTTGGTIQPTNGREHDIDGTLSAKETFRGSISS